MLSNDLKNNLAWEVKDAGFALAGKLDLLLLKLNAASADMRRVAETAEEDSEHAVSDSLLEKYEDCYTQLLACSDKIRRAIVSCELAPALIPKAVKHFEGTEHEISLRLDGEKLLVRTPHVGSRRTKLARGIDMTFCSDYTDIYSEEVGFLIRENAGILPDYRDKIVSVIAVYPELKKNLPDSDNLDVKKIIDAITGELRGGDAAGHCGFFRETLIDSSILPGTYFLVQPRDSFTGKSEDFERILFCHYAAEGGKNEQKPEQNEQNKYRENIENNCSVGNAQKQPFFKGKQETAEACAQDGTEEGLDRP